MMSTIDTLKLALEALEAGEYYIDDLEAIVYDSYAFGTHEDRAKMQEAITAIKQALNDATHLAAPVLEPAWYHAECNDPDYSRFTQEKDEAFAIVSDKGGYVTELYTRAQPAPVQEPVAGCACRWNEEGDRTVTCIRHQGWLEVISEWAGRAREAEAKLKATPPAQEFVCSTGLCHYKATSEKRECMNCAAFGECNPNNDAGRCGYEPPAAQRQWVGLTDEDKKVLVHEYVAQDCTVMPYEFLYAIEAKLKEKNT
jgi:hypothetical protein